MMMQVVWNIFKSLYGIIYSILRPLRRVVCRRRRSSESDGSELTSIGTGDLRIDTPNTYGQLNNDEEEIEMEAWDSWNEPPLGGHQGQHAAANGMAGRPPMSPIENYYYNQKMSQAEPEPEPDFFGDMAPRVKKQQKIFIGKKESTPQSHTGTLLSKMAVMSDIPPPTTELGEWEEESNAWDTGEVNEDLTWQAEEAIREKRKTERLERQLEHQKRKQKKEEMRGMKTSPSLLATKLS